MNDTIQQILVVAAILGAVIYLALRGRKKSCGKGDCGCGSKKTPPE